MKKLLSRIDTYALNLLLIGALFGMIFGMGLFALISDRCAANLQTVEPETETQLIIEERVIESTEAPAIDYIEEPSSELAEEPAPNYDAIYELSASERILVESVVMAEAGGECFDGQVAVAQCILNACIKSGLRPDAVIRRFGYTYARPTASKSVINAVSAVFNKGDVVTTEPIMYFYAPAVCSSPWHESQTYVLTIGGHKFFKEA